MHVHRRQRYNRQDRQTRARASSGWRLSLGAVVVLLLMLVVSVQASGTTPAVLTDAAVDSGVHFVVEIGSRLYTDWHETVRVQMLETFYLADTDLTARVERFVPDFRISETGRIISQSDQPENPAVHIVVFGDSATSDSTWAFLNFPPHFSPESFFTFRLKEIEGYVPATRDADPAIKREDVDG